MHHAADTGRKVLLVAGIILIAFNLRPALTSVGPLVDDIRSSLALSNTLVGLLTTLPLLAFAIFSPWVPRLGQRIGNERTLILGLAALVAGILVRSGGQTLALFIGTALVGLGIAVANVLLPAVVKHRFPNQVGLLTSSYSTAMNVCAALASGISIPLAHGAGWSWRNTLLCWGALGLCAILVWSPQLRAKRPAEPAQALPSRRAGGVWRAPLAWMVTLFMGLQSFLFYSAVAWLTDILHADGYSVSTAGWLLSVTQFIGLPATFVTPILAARLADQRSLALILGLIYTGGFVALCFSTPVLAVLAIIGIGIGQGASISLALAYMGLRTRNARQAAILSGMAQSIGYLMAAAGPVLLGFLYDHSHTWRLPLFLLAAVSVLMSAAAIAAGRNRFIAGE
ncbi:CynX/NimT family MFS transporter [Alicyclobacillus kakegawensis]|uniref:CynX/NimT family MFS transporter n=1 Tax=Alicyclobacillus kakegawensis TaxID=392012 RepID=UPI000834BA55